MVYAPAAIRGVMLMEKHQRHVPSGNVWFTQEPSAAAAKRPCLDCSDHVSGTGRQACRISTKVGEPRSSGYKFQRYDNLCLSDDRAPGYARVHAGSCIVLACQPTCQFDRVFTNLFTESVPYARSIHSKMGTLVKILLHRLSSKRVTTNENISYNIDVGSRAPAQLKPHRYADED